ncbi:hypothetical protein BGZ80_010988 [Entomortierella chlamydospora]|uniref:BZIP domain-containing protein n=1 Tax=Entomortierella chlamydospora TaxID=101097 RepID=A0A9P6MUU8_9FUNG|nr:hypothetical protein BGZ79_009216 [Entomortierella chlamydospora]KAG0013563.1 hypothetical protein BGZ80_010988 [Entomortierella chlamydospora]
MAVSIDFNMFDTTNIKLSKSADALESALAQFGKNTPSNNDSSAAGDLFTPSANSGNGFDEWLAADLAFGALSSDESSVSSSSPFSSLEDSPVLGFDSFGSTVGSSLFDIMPMCQPMNANGELPKVPKLPLLTSTAVQQAAAALNIPWSVELESAVMAQAALSAVASAPAPVPQTMASPILVPKTEPEEIGFASIPSSAATSRAASAAPAATPVKKSSKKRQLTPEEEAEEIIAKRAKNTDAARRSRLKKLIKLEGLEAKVSDLETANNALNMKIAILETEKNGFIAKDAEQTARIAQLEAQLAEAHAALANRA